MSAAMKNLTARTKRAKLIAAMGLVNRDESGFKVKSPTRSKEVYQVWRDEKGRVRCSCAEFDKQWQEDPLFRCEHILAVKYHLEPPSESGQPLVTAEASDRLENKSAETNMKRNNRQVEPELEMNDIDETAHSFEEHDAQDHIFPAVLKRLSAPIPRELVRQRVGWKDSYGHEHEIDYIEWHTVADLLDRVCPQWSHSVKEIRQIGDLVAVTASITIHGVTREGVGTGAAYDEKGIKKAEHDALKRAAVKFGIARELYKKDEDDASEGTTGTTPAQPVLRFPRDPIAKSMADMATPKQIAAIRAIAGAQGVDADAECSELLNCKLEDLSRRAASAFIDHLKNKQSALTA